MVQFPRSALIAASLLLASCTDPAMEKRVTDLEAKVKTIEDKGVAGPVAGAPAGEAAAMSADEEKAAADLFQQANEAAEAGKYDDAKAKLAELNTKYAPSRAAKRAGRLSSELAVIGVDAGTLDVEKWYAGNTSMGDGKATLLVFWETWCPHCQREVPKMEETFTKYHDKGLNIVALTKVTRSSSDEKVNEFIKENKLTFPIAKESGNLSERFGVQGIPAAAIVKDGKVVWRGHPARITDEMINQYIGT